MRIKNPFGLLIDINDNNDNGCPPLIHAVTTNANPEIIDILLTRGAGINATGNDDCTPLMPAATHKKYPEIIATLLKEGVDIGATDNNKKTVYEYASDNEHTYEAMKVLFGAGIAELEAKFAQVLCRRKLLQI